MNSLLTDSATHAALISRRPTARVLLALVVVAAAAAAARTVGGDLPAAIDRINGWGLWGLAVFIGGYVAACLAWIPGFLLALAAGAVFGLARGTAVVFAGATLGATAAFLIARHVARGTVERRLANTARFPAMDRAIGVEGFKIVSLLRLSAIYSVPLLNYALGLSQVRFADYVLASVGMLPSIIVYVSCGVAIGEITARGSGTGFHESTHDALLVLGAAAVIIVAEIITRFARRALQVATGPASQTMEMRTPSAPPPPRVAADDQSESPPP